MVRSWSAGLGMGPNFASGLRVPAGCPGRSRAQNKAPEGPRPKTPCGNWPKRGVCYSLGGGVGRSWSAGLGMGPNSAIGHRVPEGCPVHSRAQKRPPEVPRPKTPCGKGPKRGVGYSLGSGGGGKLVRRTRNGAKLCERPPCARGMTRAQARQKNERPNYPVPKPPSGKGPKRGVCYSLGGGVGLSWSAGLGMGP